MGFFITQRAFRFQVGTKQYAVDIQNEGIVYPMGPALHLFFQTPAGDWNRAHIEMEPILYIDQGSIDAAGGVVKLCKLIVIKLNKALRILHGTVADDDLPPAVAPHELVMEHLRTHLSLTMVAGVPSLQLSE